MHVLNKTWGIEISDPINQQTGNRQNPTLKDQIKQMQKKNQADQQRKFTHMFRDL
jgi:transcription initiation factor TFIID subunit TAF12